MSVPTSAFTGCLTFAHSAIADARLGFKLLRGLTITIGFATESELRSWAKMTLPKSDRLKDKVALMDTPKIGTNFEFTDLPVAP